MKISKKLFTLGLALCVSGLSALSCARNATGTVNNKVMLFSFKVRGNMVLNRSDVTYYVILYAPTITTTPRTFSPNIGPRVNAPNITRGIQFLEGRLPFVHQLPADQETQWTDFFYITSIGGRTTVGRGRFDPVTKNPVIYDRNYTNQNTRSVSGTDGRINGFQIEFFLNDLNNKGNTEIITGNFASSDSIDNGNGFIYDSWRNNTPFQLSLTTESQQSQQDINANLVMRRIPNRPDPVLPIGVNPDDVNFSEFTARITQ